MIRDAQPEDAPAIARIHIDGWRAAYPEILPAVHLESLDYEQRATRWSEILRNETSFTIVAVDEEGTSPGDLTGWLSYGPLRDEDIAGMEIYGIYLAPACWRRGIGSALMREALGRITEREGEAVAVFLWVLEENQPARRFYEQMGFRSDGQTKGLMIGGKECVELRYVWRTAGVGKE